MPALKRQSGYVLLLAMFAVSVMALHTTVGLSRTAGETLAATLYTAKIQAFHAAESGIDVAVAELARGGENGAVDFSKDEEGWADAGVSCGSSGPCSRTLTLCGTQVTVQIEDLSAPVSRIVSTGTSGAVMETVEARLSRPQTSPFTHPLRGVEAIEIGSQVLVDSYNSSLGDYGAMLDPQDPSYQSFNRSCASAHPDCGGSSTWHGSLHPDSVAVGAITIGSETVIFGDVVVGPGACPRR